MKICSSCNETKPFSDFNRRSASKDGYQVRCRSCTKTWYKEYYDNDPKEKARLKASNIEARNNLKKIVRDIKNQPCADCGESYPYFVMDFDHQYDKKFNISSEVSKGAATSRILEEISKCDVVCANCHRIRTHGSTGDSDDMLLL